MHSISWMLLIFRKLQNNLLKWLNYLKCEEYIFKYLFYMKKIFIMFCTLLQFSSLIFCVTIWIIYFLICSWYFFSSLGDLFRKFKQSSCALLSRLNVCLRDLVLVLHTGQRKVFKDIFFSCVLWTTCFPSWQSPQNAGFLFGLFNVEAVSQPCL